MGKAKVKVMDSGIEEGETMKTHEDRIKKIEKRIRVLEKMRTKLAKVKSWVRKAKSREGADIDDLEEILED